MAKQDRRVVFGRINRRQPDQGVLEMREFSVDMIALAESHKTIHTIRSTGGRPGRTWVAADMSVTPDNNFMTGVLGYSEQQQQVTFDDESFSWMKGEVESSDSANEQTIVPFAVDLRSDQRWVAFATTSRLQPQSFSTGLESVFNEAVIAVGLIPVDWEVDLVTSTSRIMEWLRENPRVHKLRRTLKFSNPGKDLDDDRAEMRALAANRKTEEFKAPRGKTLNIDSQEFESKLEGTETGNLHVILESRGSHGVRNVKFNSNDTVDNSLVEDFGSDLQRGIEIVLAALREYVASKGDPEQPQLAVESTT
ncbi:hypothetical protein [Mycolicibacterium goodii]|uniref:Recombination-associated protein RdgC n=1 Tax=Mycolicibacterium goodii TaxID=134601 RepID=A0ABS6HV68_MYCGD|nr:hypothetical protein [Mycolicibacterium goodii]MBU8825820.1 hypothetical protein [Mycolicibacterium goodii]MBU8840794.1 hypothetical protein [Mycolicibacterium goodii]